jgi:phage recombination protein Bet
MSAALVHGHAGGIGGAMVTGPSLARTTAPLEFTHEQRAMIRDTFANGASESEFAVLMEIARARGLNPLLKQIHFVKRWDDQKQRDVWSAQTSIDGLRAIAQRTGLYGGQDEPEYVDDDKGFLLCAKVRVYRKDWTRPSVGVAHWNEYVQTKRNGQPTRFWQTMPRNQLAKCAEALALRKAFPEDMSGLYIDAEMEQADNEVPAYLPEQRPALAAKSVVDPALFAGLAERIDRAETRANLTAIASDAIKAHAAGAITDAQRAQLAAGVKQKGSLLGVPRSPASDPEAGNEDRPDETDNPAQEYGQ